MNQPDFLRDPDWEKKTPRQQRRLSRTAKHIIKSMQRIDEGKPVFAIKSAEATRYAYTDRPLPTNESENRTRIKPNRLRNLLGRILPKIDPVIHKEKHWMNGYWETEETHQSGRVSRDNRLHGAIYIPTVEFVDPYLGLSEEEKQQMVAQFEAPPTPGEIESSQDG